LASSGDGFSWPELITGAVAVYGAILSSITFYFQRRAARPTVRASFATDLVPDPVGQVETVFILRAENHGHRKVYVQQPVLDLPGEKQMVFPYPLRGDATFPHGLEPGQSCTVILSVRDTVRSLRSQGYSGTMKVTATFPDQLGTRYRSPAFKLDLGKWARLAED
jgi:hypothetical protein